ncbi:E3 ubiquitin-protein ligase cblA-like [Physella acuta]|uniref:E3 ubiquitin-protein ligase cblA-like n=1 Tax=Physella acuta TaxID=109671 RepID=UPI0027DB36A4|nr:E3 ubiquitin-protein ligase cblA-like [Physella acuta]
MKFSTQNPRENEISMEHETQSHYVDRKVEAVAFMTDINRNQIEKFVRDAEQAGRPSCNNVQSLLLEVLQHFELDLNTNNNAHGSFSDENTTMEISEYDNCFESKELLQTESTSNPSESLDNAKNYDVCDGLDDTTSTYPAHEKNRLMLQALKAEQAILRTNIVCRECKRSERDCIFMPCGHFIACFQCADKISTCPLCCKVILATAKTHIC